MFQYLKIFSIESEKRIGAKLKVERICFAFSDFWRDFKLALCSQNHCSRLQFGTKTFPIIVKNTTWFNFIRIPHFEASVNAYFNPNIPQSPIRTFWLFKEKISHALNLLCGYRICPYVGYRWGNFFCKTAVECFKNNKMVKLYFCANIRAEQIIYYWCWKRIFHLSVSIIAPTQKQIYG